MRDLRFASFNKEFMLASNGVHFNSYFILKLTITPPIYTESLDFK